MPLQKDNEYRGAHAIHVYRQPKIGRHLTVITAAVPLVDWMLEDERVIQVIFGRIINASKLFDPRIRCETQGSQILLVLVAPNAAQSVRVITRKAAAALELAPKIKQRWSEIVGLERGVG